MASTSTVYSGGDNGMDYSKDNLYSESAGTPAGMFGFNSQHPNDANMLRGVFEKLRTGAKNIELTGLTTRVLEAIPKQHFDEIRRLKQLAGAEITFHGPVVEPSGIGEQGWNEFQRAQAEKQMLNAIEMAARTGDKNKEENMVVTFHSSAIRELQPRVMTPEGEKITELLLVDDRGNIQPVKLEKGLIPEKEKGITKEQIKEFVDKQNHEFWSKAMSGINFHALNGKSAIMGVLEVDAIPSEAKEKIGNMNMLEFYKKATSDPKVMSTFEDPKLKQAVEHMIDRISEGKSYVSDAYMTMEEFFRKAVNAANETGDSKNLEILNDYAKSFSEKNKGNRFFKDVNALGEFADEVMKGVNILTSMQPRVFKPVKEAVIDKSSETFANLAFESFSQYKKGEMNTLPIISIENPPAGMEISHGDDLRALVIESRKKFVRKAVDNGMSEKEASAQAEKMIGATWDLGHINMLRKYGYGDKELIKESEKIGPYLKHIHLSDNFGYEHTELPMGMGNVPTQGHMKALGEKAKKVKQIIEVGDWYQYFKTTPFVETLKEFNSPIYSMKMSPSWKLSSSGITGEYSVGRGIINPDINQSVYGTGFSGLPTELGGQMQNRSRFSGAPIE